MSPTVTGKVEQFIGWLSRPVGAAGPEEPPPEPPAAEEPPPEAPPPPPPPPPPAVEEPPADAVPTTDTAGPLKLNDVIKTVITAVATAVGVVGLLAVVGGAVSWLRFRQLGLPSQTALTLTPKDDLVGLGATGLVIFVGIAILVVALLYAVDPCGHVTNGTLGALAIVLLVAVAVVVSEDEFKGAKSELLMVFLALVLTGACLRIARASEDLFLPFGVAVFFAVLLFGAAYAYRVEADSPKAQPAAVLRGDEKKGLIGFFVAASDDRIYIARLARDGQPGGLYDIKRDDSTRLAVGRRISCESGSGIRVQCAEAQQVAIALRKQLLTDRPPKPATTARTNRRRSGTR